MPKLDVNEASFLDIGHGAWSIKDSPAYELNGAHARIRRIERFPRNAIIVMNYFYYIILCVSHLSVYNNCLCL